MRRRLVVRLRPSFASQNGTTDHRRLAGAWQPTQLEYAAVLRVTYTTH